jgi:tetratricopeptide (TPR) repeat protein
VLNALYHQGVRALQRGDHLAAIAALAPVVDEASDAYPDARAWLEAALKPGARRGARLRVPGWLRSAPTVVPPLWGRARAAVPPTAWSWLGSARTAAEGIWTTVRHATASDVRRPARPGPALLGPVVSRNAFAAWGLVTLAAGLLVGGLLVHRGSSGETPPAEYPAPVQVPTAVPDSDLFARCGASVEAASWADAIRTCRTLHARAPEYPGLADRLAAAYVGRGQQRLDTGGDFGAAATDFEQALSYQPESAEAQRAWQQLHLYRQGDAALAVADWEGAVAQFSADYADAPDYLQNLADRSLEAKLFTAWLRWGQSAVNAGDLASAAVRCGQALALVPADPEAQECVAAASPPDLAADIPESPAPPAE